MKLVRCLGHVAEGGEPEFPISGPLLTSCVTFLNFSQLQFSYLLNGEWY